MDGRVVPNEGVKRRLPVWMLGEQDKSKSESVKSNHIGYVDKGNEEDEERVKKRGRRPKSKSQQKGTDDGNLKLKEESASVLVRCRKRKQTAKEVIIHDSDDNGEVVMNKRTRRGRTKKSFEIETDEDIEDFVDDGDDEDLTVEDLMRIAKEYVQEDNGVQEPVPPKQIDVNITQSDSSHSVTELNGRFVGSQGTSSCSMPENQTSEIAGFKPIMSGDPAQDMLNLFLGPLLKKTQEPEKESRLITEEPGFTLGVEKQRNLFDIGEAPVVVAKKKSSLKDKVAMFLD